MGALIGVSEATIRNAKKRNSSSNACDHDGDEAAHPRTDSRMEREVTVVRGGKEYTMKVAAKTQKPVLTVKTVDPETAARYAAVMAEVVTSVCAIMDKVDAVSQDGMTPQMLATIAVEGMNAADVARLRTGGRYVGQVCDSVAAHVKQLAERKAS